MPVTEPTKLSWETAISRFFFRLLFSVTICFLGIYGLQSAFNSGTLDGESLPALVLLFTAGMLATRRKRSILFRVLAIVIAAAVSAVGWWITPIGLTHGLSLREATRYRDEIKAELSAPATFENAYLARDWGIRRKKLDRSYWRLCKELDEELLRWAKQFAHSARIKFKSIPADDIAAAIRIRQTCFEVANSLGTSSFFTDTIESEWLEGAIALQARKLEALPRRDWEGFNRTSSERMALAEAFYFAEKQLERAEETWVFESISDELQIILIHTDPKMIRERCREAQQQLLTLKCIAPHDYRFPESRRLLFQLALSAVQKETEHHIKAGRVDIAYGIARKFAVDWFATAEMIGEGQTKRLEELRDKCRDRADVAGKTDDSPEITPLPRVRDTAPTTIPELAPPPRLKP